MGSIQLAPATIDVLGYAPELVRSPAQALERFAADNPSHPYAHVGEKGVRAALEWFVPRAGVLSYRGRMEDNLVLASAVGALRPTAVAPAAAAAGDLRSASRVAIVGWRALKDFYADYLADNLPRSAAAAGIEVAARAIEVEVPNEAGVDVSPLGFARRFEDPAWRRRLGAELAGRLRAEDAVGFPAVLGLDRHLEVWRELQESLGTRVFEIPTLPPSVPGLRLYRVLKSALRAAGARLFIGTPVAGARTTDGRIGSVLVRTAARDEPVAAQQFVLASGGWASGGIQLDSHWRAVETIFGLPVAGVPAPGEPRLLPDYFDDHPLARAGVATDDELRPLGPDGAPAYANLRVAGATLAGARPWHEKSGDGISLSTGFAAARAIVEEQR